MPMSLAKSPRMLFKVDWLDTVDGIECKTLAAITLGAVAGVVGK
jgi:hypothetical protein